MFGPRIAGENGIELRTPVRDDYALFPKWQLEPAVTRFWLVFRGSPRLS